VIERPAGKAPNAHVTTVLTTEEAAIERVVIVVAGVPEVAVEVSGGEVAGANGLGKSTGSVAIPRTRRRG
jgi:hypothetical protein